MGSNFSDKVVEDVIHPLAVGSRGLEKLAIELLGQSHAFLRTDLSLSLQIHLVADQDDWDIF